MIQAIFETLDSVFSLGGAIYSSKYQKKAYKLRKEYDEESDKTKPDRNKLDNIERDILRIAGLVNSEVKRQETGNL